ncbi:Histone chaperone, ASF1-like protein [Pseudocohnilembus persalinus]|uniref:Histone chaperone, ASF1-like protein n=1 Tax=Pseudocohnilembus persalinus TaxID=266149 RepID=A0A0V0QL93_PSEPJ|nr:Histone chaperone, ASF1-like protein [Pseudocohnilembus persalinus]|eukprot:KRX02919.1 Histone chaperone, ASF1-like protein [Pseudocohnilembus persalinus]
MARINIQNVEVQNNPCMFSDPFQLQITFESTTQILEEDCIDWTLIYVASAKDEKSDIILDKFSMGPIDEGVMQFVLESEAPDPKKIPSKEDLMGITAIILSVSYKNQEFFRVGYYLYNVYVDQELLENDPEEVVIEKVQRQILANKPRITRFDIDWGDGLKQKEHEQFMQINQNYNENENSNSQQLNNNYSNNNNNNNNSVSFGMFSNNQTMQEVTNHFKNQENLQQSQQSQNFNQNQQQQFDIPQNKQNENSQAFKQDSNIF